MITVSSCGVKLQEVLSGLERERLKHWRYTCTFVAFLNIIFVFLSTWGVIFIYFFWGGGGGGVGSDIAKYIYSCIQGFKDWLQRK